MNDGPNGPSEPDETDGGVDELPEQMRVRRAKLDRFDQIMIHVSVDAVLAERVER